MSDAINPDHYKRLPAEAIEIIEAMIAGAPDNRAAYLHGQGAKYDLRLWGKGKSLEDYLTDWQKHIWYALRLESHLMELIEKQKADEQQKASDLQSLKDHPFGKLRQLKWTPKIGDWVRIRKPSEAERDGCQWLRKMDKYDGLTLQYCKGFQFDGSAIVYEGFAFPLDWLEPAEQPVIKQSLNTEPPDGWRWLEVGEKLFLGDTTVDGDGKPYLKSKISKQYCERHTCQMSKTFVRRNRFEVGEKVIDCRAGVVFTVQHFNKTHKIVFVDGVSDGIESKHFAPYIEEAK